MSANPANIRRQILAAARAWGVANSVPVKIRSIRDPLGLDEDEAVILRWGIYRRRKTRSGQYRGLQIVEFHCVSKRGDLRVDRKADRADVLAALIEDEFHEKQIDLLDYIGQTPGVLGSLQFGTGSWRNGDQRATVFRDGVDYTLETPKIEHVVVSYSATMNS